EDPQSDGAFDFGRPDDPDRAAPPDAFRRCKDRAPVAMEGDQPAEEEAYGNAQPDRDEDGRPASDTVEQRRIRHGDMRHGHRLASERIYPRLKGRLRGNGAL